MAPENTGGGKAAEALEAPNVPQELLGTLDIVPVEGHTLPIAGDLVDEVVIVRYRDGLEEGHGFEEGYGL
jgi:hypothetical protein